MHAELNADGPSTATQQQERLTICKRGHIDPPTYTDVSMAVVERCSECHNPVKVYVLIEPRFDDLEKALEAANAYIEHLKDSSRHKHCRRRVGPGHYVCGYLIDYEEACEAA